MNAIINFLRIGMKANNEEWLTSSCSPPLAKTCSRALDLETKWTPLGDREKCEVNRFEEKKLGYNSSSKSIMAVMDTELSHLGESSPFPFIVQPGRPANRLLCMFTGSAALVKDLCSIEDSSL